MEVGVFCHKIDQTIFFFLVYVLRKVCADDKEENSKNTKMAFPDRKGTRMLIKDDKVLVFRSGKSAGIWELRF